MEKLKVLQFIPSLNKYDGGTTTYMQQLAPSLGMEVELHLCALTPIEELVSVENCRLHSIPLQLSKWREMKRCWLALLETIQPDVVHFNCCWMPQIALVIHWTHLWRGKKQVKLFLTPHGMLEPWIVKRHYWSRKLPAILLYQRRALHEVDCVVATAEEEKTHLQQLGWNKNVVLVRNGILVDGIRPKNEWNNHHRLLFMSRIHPKKGLELLFEAIELLRGRGIDFSLTIAGDGAPEYVSKLKKVAPSGVTFLGPIYDEKKWAQIESADLVVLPSYSENYGLIIAEALASATPVLTTTGTPWRCVQQYQAGWWVPPTAEAISSALMAFSKCSSQDLSEMGLNARRLALSECSVDQTAQKLLDLYK